MVTALSSQASLFLFLEKIFSLKNKISHISSFASDHCSFSSVLLCCALSPDISPISQDSGPNQSPQVSDIYSGSFSTQPISSLCFLKTGPPYRCSCYQHSKIEFSSFCLCPMPTQEFISKLHSLNSCSFEFVLSI